MLRDKQLILKPFDFVLAVKVAVNKDKDFLIAQLAQEFDVSLSTVHSALRRGEASRLLSRSSGPLRAVRSSLQEFAICGLKYAFPAVLGRSIRGVPTSIGAPVLARHFEATDALVPVWPHPEGKVFGFELVPLHPSVPKAALKDDALYEVLALVDAVRVGAAREREIAVNELQAKL
jgi:hypothetical protein